jgi:hypothetical protein
MMSAITATSPLESRTSVARTRLRITRRGRIVLTTIAALPLVVAAAVLGLNGGAAVAGFGDADVAFETITVAPGDSLWSIAQEVAPTADPREVIGAIMNLNGLATATLEPGQRLSLPLRD